ncbi:lactate dehydrogenase-like 2-hydroxyacid dehydrogenase [Stella humosa]|uniref:Lactate dehydrogenase-like 2-hydroxyacid dehydrogenase n=1 Tax=Stella humosa TaxID=94 RepID=A0A3N1KHM2_9PROT|nr:D-2-hydroxyacid dehydrogenase family protein [Stella humosa]ROP81073.1 lactate dehydrogenase-like 2-hydroxyacid dehydrogenase [Stella humosa]BBK29763.1 2-hydroxyacid dehydrogenase [Stella humosa]
MTLRIAVLDDYQRVALQFADWSQAGADAEIVAFDDNLADEGAVAARLADFDVVCIMRERTPFRRALVERLPRLKLLVTTGMRNAAVDLAALAERGVTVCGTGAPGGPTAELTWGLILALMRQIPREDRAMRAGRWQETIGQETAGRTLGVLGLGRLGAKVAKIGQAFDMNVIAWSPNLTAERAAEAGVRLVSKEALFAEADVVTIHVVLSPRSRGLVGADDLARMKPTAYLVNTARGPIVDEAALIDALRQGRIAGAGIDVYGVEPIPADHPLLALDNTVLTPHLGYVTEGTYGQVYPETVEAIAAWRAGKPIRVLTA